MFVCLFLLGCKFSDGSGMEELGKNSLIYVQDEQLQYKLLTHSEP